MQKLKINTKKLVKPKKWSQEAIVLALVIKRFGKNGLLSFDVSLDEEVRTLNLDIKDGKIILYAE